MRINYAYHQPKILEDTPTLIRMLVKGFHVSDWLVFSEDPSRSSEISARIRFARSTPADPSSQ